MHGDEANCMLSYAQSPKVKKKVNLFFGVMTQIEEWDRLNQREIRLR